MVLKIARNSLKKNTLSVLYFVKLFKIQLSDARQWYPSEFRTPSKKFKSQSDQKHSPPWKYDGSLCTYLEEEVWVKVLFYPKDERKQFVVNLRQWIQHMEVYVASFFLHSFIQPDGHIHSTIINQPPNISLFKGNIKSKYENITNVIAVRLICAIYTQKSWFIDCPFGVLESVDTVFVIVIVFCNFSS